MGRYEKTGVLLDIATTEYLMWKPIFQGDQSKSKNIVNLEESQSSFIISALGLERLCMAVNDLPTVRDVDYISRVYDLYEEVINKSEDEYIVESLRALHRVYSDIKKFGFKLSKHHKIKMRPLLRSLPLNKLNRVNLEELLNLHAETQPWHPELKDGIEPTIERILQYQKLKL